jgi:predicted transcriptional regulator
MKKKEYFKREGSKLDNTLTITITDEEKLQLQQIATDRKQSVSQFVRESIRNEIKR